MWSDGIEESRLVSDKHIKSYLYIALYTFKNNIFANLYAGKLLRFHWQNDGEWFLLFLGLGFDSTSPWRSSREQRYNKDKIMAFQWNMSLVANLERQNFMFKTLHISRKYIRKIFRNMLSTQIIVFIEQE